MHSQDVGRLGCSIGRAPSVASRGHGHGLDMASARTAYFVTRHGCCMQEDTIPCVRMVGVSLTRAAWQNFA